jgi:(1->4)-alpha-D-glucan 1-alpha-D-glucosylmutase
VLKIAAPGVPDVYQGQEMWDFSLVDPDNRRPVDYERRASALAALRQVRASRREELAGELLASWPDGRIKLWVTHRALRCRREHSALFRDGDYRPLATTGRHADRVVSFARVAGDDAVVAVAPRLVSRLVPDESSHPLGAAWADTALDLADLPPGPYRDVFTGATLEPTTSLALADLFRTLPVVLLERAPAAT